MKHYKKRTIALVLASVITVVGAFGAENYRNSLMSLKFESSSSGSVNMTVLTKRDYANNITPVKRDATTYVIMLPETNSQMPSAPELTGDVESVDVKTMPYTKSNQGYTKITVKTLPNVNFKAQKAIYLPEKEKKMLPEVGGDEEPDIPVRSLDRPPVETRKVEPIRSQSGVNQVEPEDINKSLHQFETGSTETKNADLQAETQETDENVEQLHPTTAQNSADESSEIPSSELILAILGVILAISVSAFFVLKAKDKMSELTGEQQNLDFSDDDIKPKRENKKKKIQNTIKTLDKMYTKPVKMPVNIAPEIPENTLEEPDIKVEQAEDSVVVDLDELFQEQTRKEPVYTEEEENSALDDFLNSFSFMDEEIPAEETTSKEDLYNKYINDEKLNFTNDDIDKINKLLNSEISDDAIKTLAQTAVSNPIEKKQTKTEILENLITSYTINQNISFSKDDVEVLKKLINVEINSDFITDLRCNPQRTQEMQEEMARQKSKPHKTSELITLNVKDMLPDLSEALKKQGGRRIESEVKPQVVYYSEGYDVSTLKLNEDLPDLAKEIDNEEAYKSQPSEAIQYVASGYDVAKMSISDELPDLSDVMKNPEKYETKEETPEIDEEALLRNLNNVTFKPFQDGYQAPSVSDMQEEFSKLDDNFEIVNPEEDYVPNMETDNDDFAALYDTNYVDLDKDNFPETETSSEKATDTLPIKQEIESEITEPDTEMTVTEEPQKEEPNDESVQEKLKEGPVEDKQVITKVSSSNEAQKLIKLIEAKRAERKVKNHSLAKNSKPVVKEEIKENKNEDKKEAGKTCSVEGGMYSIISKTEFTDSMGCYLAKNENGYCVIGYVGDKLFKVKNYDKLKTEKMESRVSDKLDNGSIQYIIRLGIHKFIMNVSSDDMEYIMDLC